MKNSECTEEVKQRQCWLGYFAKADLKQLEKIWEALPDKPKFLHLRAPETGLVMVRGRAGGTGRRFNLGEMTLSRCAVRLTDGSIGFGYTRDRNPRHAELAALFDALLQNAERRTRLEPILLAPLMERQSSIDKKRAAKRAATKVDFFTLVRGDE